MAQLKLAATDASASPRFLDGRNLAFPDLRQRPTLKANGPAEGGRYAEPAKAFEADPSLRFGMTAFFLCARGLLAERQSMAEI
jgi:hypothetical protein